jgi:hypothetical protein
MIGDIGKPLLHYFNLFSTYRNMTHILEIRKFTMCLLKMRGKTKRVKITVLPQHKLMQVEGLFFLYIEGYFRVASPEENSLKSCCFP